MVGSPAGGPAANAPKAPVIVAVHGGGWQGGSPAAYKHWGPYLAKRGYAMFAIKYRLAKDGTYPKAVYDVKSAIQAMRAKGWHTDSAPGRHILGSNLFWYFQNPNGGKTEYFADMDQMDDDFKTRNWEKTPGYAMWTLDKSDVPVAPVRG